MAIYEVQIENHDKILLFFTIKIIACQLPYFLSYPIASIMHFSIVFTENNKKNLKTIKDRVQRSRVKYKK